MRSRSFQVLLIIICFLLATSGARHSNAQSSPSVTQFYDFPPFWDQQGRYIAFANGSQVQIVDAGTATVLFTLSGHNSNISAIAWKPDGTQLATGSSDQTIKIWDASDGTLLTSLPVNYPTVYSLAWSSDQSRLISSNGTVEDVIIQLWDTNTWQILVTIPQASYSPRGMSISPDGQRVAVAGGYLLINSATTLDLISRTALPREIMNYTLEDTVLWSPDSTKIAVSTINGIVFVWDAATGQLLHTLVGSSRAVAGPLPTLELPYTWIRSIQWSPDSTELFAVSGEGTITRWNTALGTVIATAQFPQMSTAAWSPYAGQLAYSTANFNVALSPMEVAGSFSTNAPLTIAVPFATQTFANQLLEGCTPSSASADLALQSTTTDAIDAFINRLEVLPQDLIPPGCAADLLAVAQAIGEARAPGQ